MRHETPQDAVAAAVRLHATFMTTLQMTKICLGSPAFTLGVSAALKEYLPGDTLKWWLSGVEGSWPSRSGMLTALAATWACGRPGAALGA
jgi:hypothetical protein